MNFLVLLSTVVSLLIILKIYYGLKDHHEPVKVASSNISYFDCDQKMCPKENGFLAISVNNKSAYFVEENCDKLIKNLPTGVKVIVIADEIAHYNIQAFEHKNERVARQRASEMGIKLMNLFKKSIDKYHCGVKLCKWEDLRLRLDNCVARLEKYDILDTRVSNIANIFVAYRGQNKSNDSYEKKIGLTKKYIYNELPVLICGINYDGVWHRMLYYSGSMDHIKNFTSDKESLHSLSQDIKYSADFVDVRNIIMEEMMMPDIACSGFVGLYI